MYTHSSALQLIEETFPSLREDLHDEMVIGLLHLQIGEFSRYAQEVIDAGDDLTWHQITDVFVALWANCDDSVKNALNVSFLEHLHFNDKKKQRSWAFESMPKSMRTAWQEMDNYNRKIHGG